MAEGLVARIGALELLGGVMGDGLPLSDLLDPKGPLDGYAPADRARAQRLALSVLRQVEPLDRLLSKHLRKPPPLAVMNVLRLAVVELVGGAAAHGVVNSAVEIANRGRRTKALAGLINAVLRAVGPAPVLDGPAQRMPRWLRQPMVHAYGRDAVAAIEAVQAAEPPLDLTPKAAGSKAAGSKAAAGPMPEGAVLPTGSLRLADAGQVSALPGFAEGAWWVQDAAAALAVPLLGVQPGERVLDLCAAPGGKTMQLAAAGAEVTALDISGPRLARVAQNLQRTGLRARLVTADALHWQPEALFDAVLLDAPCSASGTIRRHPDLPFVKDDSGLAALTALQAALFDRALGWVKPGGRLVYCTCSLLPEEGEAQLAAAMARHGDLRVVRAALPCVPDDWITPDGALRIRPDYWADRGGLDGFFMVCVTR